MNYHQTAKLDPAYYATNQRIKKRGWWVVALRKNDESLGEGQGWSTHARNFHSFDVAFGRGETPAEAISMLERWIVEGFESVLKDYP